MKNTTSENFRIRLKWLTEITDNKISPSKSEMKSLGTMRDFCNLSIPNLFNSISLNSLKNVALELSEKHQGLDLWADLKSMRATVFAMHSPTVATPPSASLPSVEDQTKLALLDAHISTMAYFELYNFMSMLVKQNSNNANEILDSISIKLLTSKAKHHSFLTHHDYFPAFNLTVINGGKQVG